MEERILKKAAIFVFIVSLAVCGTIFYFPRLNTASEEFLTAVKEYQTKTKAEQLNMTGLEIMEYNNEQAREEAEDALSFPGQIRLQLPLGVEGKDLTVTENYVTRTVDIRIPYAGEDYFYEYPILGSGKNIESLTYEFHKNYGVVQLMMEKVFELNSSCDGDYFYLDFLTPQELYDKVVVIDAGHGGDDPGTKKQGICEKDINLDILLELKELFDAQKDASIGVYYTRTDDQNPTLESRMELADKSDADLFISIHNNATKSGMMSSINGTQVIYDEQRAKEEPTVENWARICLEEVTAVTGSSNKGLVADSGEDITGNTKVPAAWIKVGFMTNQTELDLLRSKEYQSKAAQGIYNAVMRAFAEGY